MYKEWVDKAVYVNLYYGRLVAQKREIEQRISVLQKMAEDLVDNGVLNFQGQNIFPMGRNHFSQLIRALARISDINNGQSIFSLVEKKSRR